MDLFGGNARAYVTRRNYARRCTGDRGSPIEAGWLVCLTLWLYSGLCLILSIQEDDSAA
jgi:hypothetical protein